MPGAHRAGGTSCRGHIVLLASYVAVHALGPFVSFGGAVIEDDIDCGSEIHRNSGRNIDFGVAFIGDIGTEGFVFATEDIEGTFRMLKSMQGIGIWQEIDGDGSTIDGEGAKQILDDDDGRMSIAAQGILPAQFQASALSEHDQGGFIDSTSA